VRKEGSPGWCGKVIKGSKTASIKVIVIQEYAPAVWILESFQSIGDHKKAKD
jgi:hypothetical protein